MPNNSYPRNNLRWVVLVVVTLVALSGLLVTARTQLFSKVFASRKPATPEVPSPASKSQPPVALQGERVETELVTLRPSGFEPSEITRGTGKFLFGVNTGAGLSDLTFQLSDQTGRRVGEKHMRRERVWRQAFNLERGNYSLTVVNHPEWVCQITIR